jgi:sugar phosphate isomerase/epimerase
MHAGPFEWIGRRTRSPWLLRDRAEDLGRAGFRGIGLNQDELVRVIEYEAEGANVSQKLNWLRRLLTDNGLATVELEFLTAWLYPRGNDRRNEEESDRRLLLEAAGALGARHLKIGNVDGIPVALEQLRDAFGELCGEAAKADCRVGIEILPVDPNCQTLAQTLLWVRGPSNGGLFLDSWHVNNMPGVSYDDIALLDKANIVGVELDDGLVFDEADKAHYRAMGRDVFVAMTTQRRIPGEGDYDLGGFVSAVSATGFDGPWGCEVLSEDYKLLPRSMAYPRIYRAMGRYLGQSRKSPSASHPSGVL